jgi:hypothetical protein
MKLKQILILSLVISLLASLVTAGFFPQIVSGKVYLEGASSLQGLDVEQKNLRTGVVLQSQLDSSGYFLSDWGNSKFFDGDNVEVSLSICKDNPICRKLVVLEEGIPVSVEFNLPSEFSLVSEQNKVFVCSDGKEVLSSDECGADDLVKQVLKEVQSLQGQGKIEVLSTKYVCSDKSVVENAKDCPSDSWAVAFGVTSALLAIVASGLSALYYHNKKKYKWAIGMSAIIKSRLNKAKELKEQGKSAEASKELKTAEKTATTILNKYLKEELK